MFVFIIYVIFLKYVAGILQSNRRTIMDDPFIRNYIEDLLKNVRTQVLLKLIKPYTRIRIPFISKVKKIEPCCLSSLSLSIICQLFSSSSVSSSVFRTGNWCFIWSDSLVGPDFQLNLISIETEGKLGHQEILKWEKKLSFVKKVRNKIKKNILWEVKRDHQC